MEKLKSQMLQYFLHRSLNRICRHLSIHGLCWFFFIIVTFPLALSVRSTKFHHSTFHGFLPIGPERYCCFQLFLLHLCFFIVLYSSRLKLSNIFSLIIPLLFSSFIVLSRTVVNISLLFITVPLPFPE